MQRISRRPGDAWTALCDALERQARGLKNLAERMREERGAYVEMRPSRFEGTIQSLDALATEVAQIDVERRECLAFLIESLKLPAEPQLRTLISLAPTSLQHRLRKAGDAVDKAARTVQIESRVGTRLLESSRRVQVGLVEALCGAQGGAPNKRGASAYGRDARAIHNDPSQQTGRLVSGVI